MGNYGIHYWNKKNVFQYIISIPQLLRLNEITKQLLKKEKLDEHVKELSEATKTLDKVSSSLFFLRLDAKLESDIGTLVQVVTELIKALFLLEPLLLFYGLKQLELKKNHIARVFEYVGVIDTAISIGSFRAGLAYYCRPTVPTSGKMFSAKDLYHPLIVHPVANSITLVDKSALLTGSNMSGKTTFIRTIGINAILAQTIDTCLAKECTMPPMRIFSAMRISDDLLTDKSYYFEEILTIKTMIDESQSEVQALFLLDELFKGTNSVERIAAGKAVLSYLNKGKHMVFVSTHDMELTVYLKDSFDLYHFTEVVEKDQIAFDYKLKTGNLKTRNAIRILELNHYPKELISEAKCLFELLTNSVTNTTQVGYRASNP
jgi:DNA mismatch repair ATPase MutS